MTPSCLLRCRAYSCRHLQATDVQQRSRPLLGRCCCPPVSIQRCCCMPEILCEPDFSYSVCDRLDRAHGQVLVNNSP
jgi:hypothetical protein